MIVAGIIIVLFMAFCCTGADNHQAKAKRTTQRAAAQKKWVK